MKGLQSSMEFTNLLNSIEKQTLKRLAEIEQEDADRCAECGGEDCICCEYYIDRQKWKSPAELFGDDYDWCGPCGYTEDDEDEEEW